MKEKIVGYSALETFWKKQQKWSEVNFDQLYQNDSDLEQKVSEQKSVLDDIREKVNKLTNADDKITRDDIYIQDNILTFKNLKVIN